MKQTKFALAALLAIAGGWSLQTPTWAADTNAPATSNSADRLAAFRARMEETAKELQLTEEQRDKIRVILRENFAKLRDLRQDANLSQADRIEKAKEVREVIRAEFKKIMTPEQFTKWKEKEGQTLAPSQGLLDSLQEKIDSLNLSQEQREKLTPLYEEQMQKLRDLRDDASLSPQEKLEKLAGMRKEVMPQMKAALDADQYKKWETGLNEWYEEVKSRLQSAQAQKK